MSVKLWPSLPKDADRNGLGSIEASLIQDPDDTHVVIAVINQRRVTTDADTGETTPTARVHHIEVITGPDAKAASELLEAACMRRTGAEQLPLDGPESNGDGEF
jgi:hypothetical protein